jgi:hypothetical protein
MQCFLHGERPIDHLLDPHFGLLLGAGFSLAFSVGRPARSTSRHRTGFLERPNI